TGNGSARTYQAVGKAAFEGLSANSSVEVRRLSSCRPVKAIHGARCPIASAADRPSEVRTEPPTNERGPRQNSPPYPAVSRPSVTGLPHRSSRPLVLRRRLVQVSLQRPSATETSPNRSV